MSMCVLLSVDSSLGRVDKSTFTHQTLMELFVAGISNRDMICGSGENPKNINQWNIVTLNDGNAWHIQLATGWGMDKFKGSIALEWLPSTVERVQANHNSLTGTLDLTSLPPVLKHLDLCENAFYGEIELKWLPEDLRVLNVSGNKLTGSIVLTKLPPQIKELFLHKNLFTGETDFSRLPNTLQTLFVSDTNLSGIVYADWGKLFVVGKSKVQLHRREPF